MKKLLLCALTCILVACCSLMVACSSAEGTYKFDSVTVEGVTYKAGDNFGGDELSEDFYVIELKKGGDFTMTMSMAGLEQEGTQEKDGDTITLTVEGESIEATLDGDKLIFEPADGMEVVCKK